MQTLGAIRIQLYHQCFEQVWQHNFTSIIGLRGRHNAIDLRRSAHRPSIFESRHIDLRRLTHRSSIFDGRHIDLRRLKAETSHRQPNIAPTFRQFVTEYCPPRRSIIIIPNCAVYTHCIYNIRRRYTRPYIRYIRQQPHPTRALVMYYTPIYIAYMR